jgi:hypothetical protein
MLLILREEQGIWGNRCRKIIYKHKKRVSHNSATILTLSNSENGTFRALICATHSEEYIDLPMMYNKKAPKYIKKATRLAGSKDNCITKTKEYSNNFPPCIYKCNI